MMRKLVPIDTVRNWRQNTKMERHKKRRYRPNKMRRVSLAQMKYRHPLEQTKNWARAYPIRGLFS